MVKWRSAVARIAPVATLVTVVIVSAAGKKWR